jgi:Short C-terminal domain
MSDGAIEASASGAAGQSPPMPTVPASELYPGSLRLLVSSGVRHTIGWQVHRKAGPGFVVIRLTRLDSVKVVARFPLDPEGWESAWHALAELDPDVATAIGATLAARAEQRRAAELDSNTVRLWSMTYDGGSGGAPLTQGQAYDLRFLDNRLTISLPAPGAAVAELAYRDVEAADVDGSDRSRSSGETIAVVSGVALGGALIGLVVLGLLGLFLGALLCGLIAGAAMASANTTKGILRLRGPDSEFFFSKTGQDPDRLRIALSQPLLAIARARGGGQPAPPYSGPPAPAEPAPAAAPIPDQLAKLASLLADGLLSRDEFEQLKARVIAQS